MDYHKIVGGLAIFAVGALSGAIVCRHCTDPKIVEKEVTIVEHDTTFVDAPVYIERRVVDSVLVPVYVDRIIRDTVTDVVYVELEREQRRYQDSTYCAWVSGIEPRLDSIRTFNTTYHHIVTQYERRKWAVGVTAGYGAMISDGLRAGPYIGIGLQYNLWQF